MELAQAKYADNLRGDSDYGLVGRFIRNAQRFFSFLSPLAIFGPTEKVNGNTLKGRRKDWNLTFLAAAYGFTIALMVSFY